MKKQIENKNKKQIKNKLKKSFEQTSSPLTKPFHLCIMRVFHEGVRGIAYNSTKHNTHLFAPLVGIFFEKKY